MSVTVGLWVASTDLVSLPRTDGRPAGRTETRTDGTRTDGHTSVSTVTNRYIPLHTVTYRYMDGPTYGRTDGRTHGGFVGFDRYIPLHTVTYRYIPLHRRTDTRTDGHTDERRFRRFRRFRRASTVSSVSTVSTVSMVSTVSTVSSVSTVSTVSMVTITAKRDAPTSKMQRGRARQRERA